jgi:hypothetical protein
MSNHVQSHQSWSPQSLQVIFRFPDGVPEADSALVLVPALYVILEDIKSAWQWLYGKQSGTSEQVERKNVQFGFKEEQ